MRLRAYDYSANGWYFVTLCAARRGAVFGHVVDGVVRHNPLGIRARAAVDAIPRHHDALVDSAIVMPDHVHAVLVLVADTRRQSLSAVVGSFKARVSRESGCRLWQRGFYDHVIRDEDDLGRIREYIRTNPMRWWVARTPRSTGPDRSGPYSSGTDAS